MARQPLIEKSVAVLSWLWLFNRFLWQRFVQQNGLQTASSLAYTTLLSLVPLLTVMFGFLGGLPVFSKFSGEIQEFMFSNFVPAFSNSIQNYLLEFSSKAAQLTFTGTAFLLVIALMLMATIDNALNRIWHVRTKRNPLARFLVYWAVLTLGPLLVGIGLASTSYLLSLPALDGVYASFGLKAKLLRIMPFISSSIAFALLYVLVPNCFVYKRHALIGGIIAAFLFEMAKFGFGIYVKAMPSYQAIYGAIAVIPIFLIWIYLSWVILILGAHITFCLSNFNMLEFEEEGGNGSWDLVDAYRILGELWLAQKNGTVSTLPELKKRGIRLSQHRMGEILDILDQGNWVHRTPAGGYMLSRDMDDVSLSDLHRLLPCKPFRKARLNRKDPWEESLETTFQRYRKGMEDSLNVSVSELLENVARGKKPDSV